VSVCAPLFHASPFPLGQLPGKSGSLQGIIVAIIGFSRNDRSDESEANDNLVRSRLLAEVEQGWFSRDGERALGQNQPPTWLRSPRVAAGIGHANPQMVPSLLTISSKGSNANLAPSPHRMCDL
jgi:hypothetical protein